MFRFKGGRRSRSLSREPRGRRSRKPPASDDHHPAVPDDSFAPTEPWDQHSSSRTFQPRQGSAASAAATASSGADSDGAAPTLETFLTGGGAAAFDASHVKTVGMDDEEDDDDDAASRGAYSTISTMIQAKRRRHKRSLRGAGTPGHDAADAAGNPDALDAFLSRNQDGASPYDEAGDERSRGARTTMTGVVRGTRYRGLLGGSSDAADGRGSQAAAAKVPNKADPSRVENDHTASNSSKSRAHSHHGTSVHRSSSTMQQRRTSRTQRSELQPERNEEHESRRHVTREKSSRKEGLPKSDSYKDIGRSSSSVRDPLRRSMSKRGLTSAKEHKTIASHLGAGEKHAHRHQGRSSATVSGAPLTRNHSKEYLDEQMKQGESRSRRHKESHDSVKADGRKQQRHSTVSKNAINENGQQSLEIKGSSHRLKIQSRSSGRAGDGNVESVEKEFWNLLSTLKRPSNGPDQKDPTSDLPRDITVHKVDANDGEKDRQESLRKLSMHSHTSSRQHPHLSPQKDPKNDISKPPKHPDGSSSHVYDDRLRPSALPDSATTVQLDEYGMIKLPSSETTKSKEKRDRVHREKSLRTLGSSTRYALEDEADKSRRNKSPPRASKSSRRNSSKYSEVERTKPSRHRSHSTNRHSSVNEPGEKHPSRRSSKTGEDKDPDRKQRHHHSSRGERDSETDRERRRGRERKRLDADSRQKSSEKREKKSSHRSMSVQPSSHKHHKHRRAHSMTPRHHDDASENKETVAKTKDHFRSLLKSSSSEEKIGNATSIPVPNKMLSIKGRFSRDEDNALPRVEDKTPVSPGASVGENSAAVSDGEALHDNNNHAADINANGDGRSLIDLTDSLASPVPHIDLVDGVIVAQEKKAVDAQPTTDEVINLDNHVNRFLSQPKLENEKATVDGSEGKNIPTETANTGLWGMFRSRMKPTGNGEENYENEDETFEEKTGINGKQKAISHSIADEAAANKMAAASRSTIGSQSKSPPPAGTFKDTGISSESTGVSATKTSYPESRFLSAPHSVNSAKATGKSTIDLKSSEMASLQRNNSLSSTRLATSSESSDTSTLNGATLEVLAQPPLAGNEIRENAASLLAVPTCNGKADSHISSSGSSIVRAETLAPYNEEDVFAFFSWSSQHQEARRVIGEREKLRGVVKGSPFGRVLERVQPL